MTPFYSESKELFSCFNISLCTYIFLGLIFGIIGDIVLLRSGKTFFLAGLVSFLFGHLLYMRAFLTVDWIIPHSYSM